MAVANVGARLASLSEPESALEKIDSGQCYPLLLAKRK
jgi:hypothetical protein